MYYLSIVNKEDDDVTLFRSKSISRLLDRLSPEDEFTLTNIMAPATNNVFEPEDYELIEE